MNGHPEEMLTAYVDGECDEAQKAEIEIHLSTCEACRRLVERFRAMAACEIEPAAVDEVTAKRFIVDLRKRLAGIEKPGRAEKPMFHGFEMMMVAAAVFVIAVFIFVVLGGPMRNMFSGAVGTQTMGANQAALSGGIY